jgi:multicomponent Na+:H+ antiporter subunit D
MNVAALGTAISFAKFIFLPRGGKDGVKPGFWPGVILLLSGLVVANIVYYDAYTVANIIKPLATIGIGWLVYLFIVQRLTIKLPRVLEQFEHLVGFMSLMLVLLFWMVLA